MTATAIRAAEGEFSRIRRQALEQEWQSAFPTLPKLLDFMASRRDSFDLSSILDNEALDELAMEMGSAPEIAFDPLHEAAVHAFDTPSARTNFAQKVVEILYRVGAIGVKLQPQEKFLYSHMDQPIVPANLITATARIRVHPMLHRALNVTGSEPRPRVRQLN